MWRLTSACAALLVVGSAVSASAADLPVRMPTKAPPLITYVPTWTGCYLGGNVGAGWAREDYFDPLAAPIDANLGSHTAKGIVGGGQIGCDYQSGPWVFGIQAMFDAAALHGSHVGADVFQTRIPWFATATARIGYAVQPNLLAYLKGGIAFKRDNETIVDAITGIAEGAARTTRTGAVIGAGLEYMFWSNWSMFVEYNYMSFSRRTVDFTNLEIPPIPATFPLNIRENVSVVMVGLNYRFNWGGPVIARY